MTKYVKFEYDSWDDAECDLVCAKAVLEVLSEVVHEHGSHLSNTTYAAIQLIDRALMFLDMGRVRDDD